MFVGLPWFAIVAIVAIGGGLIYAYKEQELKAEMQSRGSSRELQELRQVVHNLKSRIENLEAIAAEEKKSSKEADPLSSIEFEDEAGDTSGESQSRSGKQVRN